MDLADPASGSTVGYEEDGPCQDDDMMSIVCPSWSPQRPLSPFLFPSTPMGFYNQQNFSPGHAQIGQGFYNQQNFSPEPAQIGYATSTLLQGSTDSVILSPSPRQLQHLMDPDDTTGGSMNYSASWASLDCNDQMMSICSVSQSPPRAHSPSQSGSMEYFRLWNFNDGHTVTLDISTNIANTNLAAAGQVSVQLTSTSKEGILSDIQFFQALIGDRSEGATVLMDLEKLVQLASTEIEIEELKAFMSGLRRMTELELMLLWMCRRVGEFLLEISKEGKVHSIRYIQAWGRKLLLSLSSGGGKDSILHEETRALVEFILAFSKQGEKEDSRKHGSRAPSVAWLYFRKEFSSDSRTLNAICKECNCVLGAASTNGTSHLLRHLKNAHQIDLWEYSGALQQQRSIRFSKVEQGKKKQLIENPGQGSTRNKHVDNKHVEFEPCDLSRKRNKCTTRSKSEVWMYFTKVVEVDNDDSGTVKAECGLCHRLFNADSKRDGTSRLRRHLTDSHDIKFGGPVKEGSAPAHAAAPRDPEGSIATGDLNFTSTEEPVILPAASTEHNNTLVDSGVTMNTFSANLERQRPSNDHNPINLDEEEHATSSCSGLDGAGSGKKRKQSQVEQYVDFRMKQTKTFEDDLNGATKPTDEYSIKNCLAVLESIEELSNAEKAKATKLFKCEQNREIFLSFKKPEIRLLWIQDEIAT